MSEELEVRVSGLDAKETAANAAGGFVAEQAPLSQTVVQKCPTCGGDAIDRSEFWEAAPENGAEIEAKLNAVAKAIENYYLALDRREHGGIAASKAFQRIEETLGMSWKRGELTKRLEQNPRLKQIYDSPT